MSADLYLTQLLSGPTAKLVDLVGRKAAKPCYEYDDAPSATLSEGTRVIPFFKAAPLAEWRRRFGAR